jgi:hypothetical protein
MRAFGLTALAVLTASCVARESFETADFNVVDALLKQGVDVSALPDLATLVARSSYNACSIAVSQYCVYQPFFADSTSVPLFKEFV